MKISSLPIIAAGLMALNSAESATIYSPNDWYAGSSGVVSVSNGGTTSATVNYTGASAAMGTIYSFFAPNATPVTLLDGMSMTLSTDIVVDLTTASTMSAEFRFGIYNSNGNRPSGTPTTPESRKNTDYPKGWTGFMTAATITTTGSVKDRIWRRDVSGTGTAFTSSTDTTRVSLTEGFSGLAVFQDNVGLSLTLTLSRSGDNLSFFGTLGNDAFSGTYTNAFANGYPATFDSIGFNGLSVSENLTSVTFNNTTITVIPEPTSLVLMSSAGLAFLLMRRRKNNQHSA